MSRDLEPTPPAGAHPHDGHGSPAHVAVVHDGQSHDGHAHATQVHDGHGHAAQVHDGHGHAAQVHDGHGHDMATTVALLRATLEAVTDGVLVVDQQARVVTYNRRFLDMWRIRHEVSGDSDSRRQLESHAAQQLRDPERFSAKLRAIYAEPDAASHDMLEFRDGRIFERDSRPQRVEGHSVGRVWSFRDVTAERRASRRAGFLAAASKLLGGTLEDETPLDVVARLSVPYLGDWCNIFLVDDDGRIASAAAHHGDPAQIAALRQLRVTAGSDRGVARVIARGEPLLHNVLPPHELDGGECSLVGPADHEALATMQRIGVGSYMVAPLRVRGQTIGAIALVSQDRRRRYDDEDLAVAIDLGQRAALAIDNQRLYRQARAAVAQRDEFLSVASHELRTPVTSLQLAVQSVLALGDAPASFLRQALETAERQTRRLTRLIDALLDVSRVQEGRLELQRDPTDLTRVAREAVRALAEDARRANCAVTVEGGELVGDWDRARLEQVVTNLLSNAIKYGVGKPIELRISAAAGWATLLVRDHGLGVPPSERARIFDRFERAVSARHYGGLGLGLYIVRRIVEAHHGRVEARDCEGEGAAFVVELPLSDTHS